MERSRCGRADDLPPTPLPSHLPPAAAQRQAEPAEKLGRQGPPAPATRAPFSRVVRSKEGEGAPGVPAPSRAGRLRTAEQEAIWGGMGAVRRRQPQRTRSRRRLPPAPPAGLIAESGLIGNANGN